MQNTISKNLLALVGAIVYTFLFFKEGYGINALIFSTLIIGGLFWEDRERRDYPFFIFIAFATLLSAIFVVWHHSMISKVTHILSFLLLIGYAQSPFLRFLWYGLILSASTLLTVPLNGIKHWEAQSTGRLKPLIYWAKLTVLPLGLGILFFSIYYAANPKFAALFEFFPNFWEQFSFDFSLRGLGKFLLGLLVCGALFWPSVLKRIIIDRERGWEDDLYRKRKKSYFKTKMNALKQEYMIAMLSMSLLNALLIVANLSDLRYVWFDFAEKSATELSQFVHEGTNLLILAILLAAGLLIYFFRGNLNFYPDGKKRLYQLAYFWIIQNAILAVSVGIRNYHYLHQYGLTSLRIGVMTFLLLVILGLFFTFRKIQDQKTIYHLFSQNSWSILGIFLIISCINWDAVITRYNLKNSHYDFYYMGEKMPDRNLYILDQATTTLAKELDAATLSNLKGVNKSKRLQFEERWEGRNWRNWNWADQRNAIYLKN